VVSGSITAQEYIISSSVTHIDIQTYSGSSNFGDDSNDIHKFIGNVDITGSVEVSEDIVVNSHIHIKDHLSVGPTLTHHTGSEYEAAHFATTNSINIAHFEGDTQYYAQINVRNIQSGSLVSSDIVATADNGTETNHFVNLGINSSTYNGGFVGRENDAYLLNVGKDLYIGTVGGSEHPSKLFLFGQNEWENPQVTISGSGQVSFNTCSCDPGYTYQFSGSAKLQHDLDVVGSTTSSYFTGSFIGDGSGLYNLPQQDLSNLATTGSNTFVGNQLINGTLIGGPDTFLITTNDLDVATQPHNLTIIPGQVSGDAPQAGYLTLSGGESNSDTIPGGTTFLQGGISNGTGINGGDVYIRGGASFGGGSDGNVYIEGSQITVNGPLLASSLTGSIDYTNLTNAPTLVSGSEQISYTGITDTPTGFTFYNNEIGVNVDVFDFGDNKTIDMQNSSILMLGSTIDSIKQTNTISNNTYSTTITQDGRYTKLHKVDVIEDDMTPGVLNTNEYDIKFDVSSLSYENSIVGSSFSVTNGTTSGDITISAGNGSPVNGQRNGGDVHLWGGSVASGGVGGNVIINSNSGDIFIGPLQNTNAVKIGGGDVNNGVSYAGGIPTFFYGDVTLESGTALNLSGVTINGADNLATTGSNTFVGNQTISGTLLISGSGAQDILEFGSNTIGTIRNQDESSKIFLYGNDFNLGPILYLQSDTIINNATSFEVDADSQFRGDVEISGSVSGDGFNKFATTGSNTFVGNQIVSGTLNISTNSGDEGGEITLGKALTNTTIAGNNVILDVFRDRVRIFEEGGSSRGAFLNVVSQSANVNSEIVTSPNLFSIQTITSASYASITPVSGTLYIIID
jgi:hypothetical protein